MKKKLLSLLLCSAMIGATLQATALNTFAGGSASLYPLQSSYSFDASSDTGSTFEVDFYLQNDGDMELDNTTFYILYDPEVIIFKQGINRDESESIIFPRSSSSNAYLISATNLNTAAAIVMKTTPIYQKKPDGKKTAAELGEMKLANLTGSYMGNGGLYQIHDSGILFAAEFEVVGAGNTEIQVTGGASMFNSTDSGNVSVSTSSCYVSVAGETTTEQATETTTVSSESTETTTAAASSSSSSSGSSSSSSGSTSSNESSTESGSEATTQSADTQPGTTGTTDGATTGGTTIDGKYYAFNDIADLPWAVDAINYLAEKKIVNGYNDGSFLPRNNVTRADYTIMLLNTLGITGTADDNFTDVPADKYYANYVGLAKKLGIATGYADGTFAPEAYVTRQDMMLLTYRALSSLENSSITLEADKAALDAFSDKDEISAYAADAIAAMVKAGIVNGSNGKVDPKSNTTRAQTAVIMYNIININNK